MSGRSLVIGIILFKATWITCIWSAAQDRHVLGAVAAMVGVALQLIGRRALLREVAVVALVGGAGLVIDGVLARATGLWSLSGQPASPAGLAWWFALWCNFGAALGLALSPLRKRVLLAAVVGCVGGPAAYFGGASLGAVVLDHRAIAFVVLALLWAAAFPGLHQLRDRLVPVDA